jgi:hypothetical protein
LIKLIATIDAGMGAEAVVLRGDDRARQQWRNRVEPDDLALQRRALGLSHQHQRRDRRIDPAIGEDQPRDEQQGGKRDPEQPAQRRRDDADHGPQ